MSSSSSPQQEPPAAAAAPAPAAPLTSTTAPGRTFASRADLAAHYKTAWHRYNLKRREAGLPVLLEADFEARWAAARAVRQEKVMGRRNRSGGGGSGGGGGAGTDHLKDKSRKKKDQHKKKSKQQNATGAAVAVAVVPQVPACDRLKQEQKENSDAELLAGEAGGPSRTSSKDEKKQAEPADAAAPEEAANGGKVSNAEDESVMEVEGDDKKEAPSPSPKEQFNQRQQHIEIDPRQCLFDRHTSSSVQSNYDRMHRKYGFFLPDQEYLHDLEGLLGYAHEKIQLGHACLYCQRQFAAAAACQKHMIAAQHAKLRYEAGVDLDEWDVFYDFRGADDEFLGGGGGGGDDDADDSKVAARESMEEEAEDGKDDTMDIAEANDGDHEDEEWEDITDDEAEDSECDDNMEEDNDDDDDDDSDLYEGYVARMGLDVTPLGELVFPDGRIIGHRGLQRYYKQRVATSTPSEAVRAAQEAAGERLYRGRVYNIGCGGANSNQAEAAAAASSSSSSLALMRAGLAPGTAAGRAGRGLLVPASSGGAGTYSQVSIYRYRAAVRKQRRGELQGRRLHNRTNQNINRMDKKHNRLMNGVSVAHAAR